jgi:hypothetical protein
MLVELELARARLARRAGMAAALRRQGLEWTGAGYRARARATRKMEQILRIPRGVDKVVVLWTNNDGTAVAEFSDGERCYFVRVPLVELTRHARRAGRRKNV